ncbi:vWA domain-containing protein [Corynebacterium meridianum]|uniref:VWA domain-containing protein n=1 Tax=Corynebacterium meridianum TaxID=2765363 RepID=A0A934I1E2_9CORY|nr:vWA domain-containing protein [Corynebacterium meridianum]MBI8989500.1 VWA domain-containing protein [Corynebacterium meridianum]MCK7677423.1 VWA domain-containing protein [Corynebacterium meridianum]
MNQNRRSARRVAAVGSVAACILYVGAVGAAAQTPAAGAQTDSLTELGACVSSRGSLDVLLLMDETESLIHEVKDGTISPDRPGADAAHNRIPAARSFVEQLLERQQDQGFTTNIRIAGFGQNYNATPENADIYGTWMPLTATSIGDVTGIIDGARDRTGEQYTNYANAIDGAYTDFSRSGSPDSCKLLVTFTDGALTAEGSATADVRARQQLCAPDGIADRLRKAGISHVGIGLDTPDNRSDFSLLRAMTAGGDCGSLPGRGAFFPADSVGSLFAAFHRALSTGGDLSAVTGVREDFTFVLDNSIDSVRFVGIGLDDLGEGAQLTLVSPGGEELVLDDVNSGALSGAEVSWNASTTPVQEAVGEMRRTGGDWAGAWKLRFTGASGDGRVFNSVRIQPDLRLSLASSEGGTDSRGSLAVREDQSLTLSVVGSDGRPHALDGSAVADVSFTPGGATEPIVLGRSIDVAGGNPVDVPIDSIEQIPANGVIDATLSITTRGTGDIPGTKLAPVSVRQALSVTPVDMPQISDTVAFTMTEPTVTVDIPVTGPGKIWVDDASVVDTVSAPDGFGEIRVGGAHTGVGNALTLDKGQSAELPVTLTVAEVKDGLVKGTIPIQVSKLDGTNEAIVHVPASGNVTVPLNKTTFVAALIGALLLALLIPLGLLYLVRKLTAKIPDTPFSAVIIDVDASSGYPTYDGQPAPRIDIGYASRNQVPGHDGVTVTAGPYTLTVKHFHPNPIAPAHVRVEQTPSVNTNGDQKNLRAKLPLAVQGSSFLVARPDQPGHYDLVVLPRLPITSAAELDSLCENIANNVPQRVDLLNQQREEAAAQFVTGGGDDVEGVVPVAAPTAPDRFGQASGGFGASPSFGDSGGYQGGFAENPETGDSDGFGASPSFGDSGGYQGGFGENPETGDFGGFGGYPGGFGENPTAGGPGDFGGGSYQGRQDPPDGDDDTTQWRHP